jgi:hypothetical protein
MWGAFSIKVKIALDRITLWLRKSDVLAKIIRNLGAKATISGDVFAVESDCDERKVIDIPSRQGIDYARSSY